MRRHLLKILILSATLLCLNGCMFIRSPFADVDELGTVLKPGECITIQGTIGPVTIEYVAPTKRRLVWKGESREFSLMKSKQLNGIYGGPMRLKQGPIENVYGVSYQESTRTFSSEKEYQEYLRTYVEHLGFEHRVNEQMIVRCYAGEGHKKYLYIGITKYQFAAENKSL